MTEATRGYSAAFVRAINLVLRHEGGYVNDPRDPGGETNFGISKRSYPNEDIKNLTKERATAIYYRDFWLAVRADELPPTLAIQVFDMAVNAGTVTAIKLLQRTVGTADDGKLGPKTLSAAHAASNATIPYARRRLRYYESLNHWETYRSTWTDRTLSSLVTAVMS